MEITKKGKQNSNNNSNYHFGAVFDGLFGVERAVFSGDALA